MIGNALREDIERFASRLTRSNRLLVDARHGRAEPATVARYLFNVQQLLRYTPRHLDEARRCATARGMPALAAAYADKAAEEVGHDRWAEQDLARLRARFGVAAPDREVRALDDLAAHISGTIERDPVLYLAYILLAEYVTVLVGPVWLRSLEERCGIPSSLLSVVAKHVELDQDHVDDGIDQIDALVDDPRYLGPMRAALRDYMERFERFFDEIGEPEDANDGTADRTGVGAALPAGA